jgi:hypothetical protein
VLEDRAAFEAKAAGQETSRAAFVLDMYRHYFEVFGLPEPFAAAAWLGGGEGAVRGRVSERCGERGSGWFPALRGVGRGRVSAHAVPARLLQRDGLPEAEEKALGARVDAVVARALQENGRGALASGAGAHIVNGETPFFEGHVGEGLVALREQAFKTLESRENGLWVWRPGSEKHKALGKDGDHTLGQAALGARIVLRAARLTGDRELRRQALECLKQMERYAVPRGAQTWECPLYQPDILAAAHAISAYCDAYQLTGDRHYLTQAVYWAKTGFPFIYFWAPDGKPEMLYNTIPVFGSTWFTHSWIGLPVVWCGLVYAYALQDLAEIDGSFAWKTVAQGITNSAMYQQYTDGASKGCYPDSWNVLTSTPNPADINPENIVLNECRLRGNSAAVRTRRVPGRVGEALVNSAFDIPALIGTVGEGKLGIALEGAGFRGVYRHRARAGAEAGRGRGRAGGGQRGAGKDGGGLAL